VTTFSIIVVTKGRPTLKRTIDSIISQFGPGDELLVLRNDFAIGTLEASGLRNQALVQAKGDYILFMDDDDCYTEGALDTIRAAVEGGLPAVHIFKMRYASGTELWKSKKVVVGNIGLPMFALPRDERLGQWTPRHKCGDFGLVFSTVCNHRTPPIFHEEVVALVKP
jgi:glycosyltransferase involved in cell wall biosynthesis